MEVDYKIFCISYLKALVKCHGLQGYSKLRKADLISLLRSHNESTRKFMKGGAQFDLEELDNEDELYPKITGEGTQFDPEESDNKE